MAVALSLSISSFTNGVSNPGTTNVGFTGDRAETRCAFTPGKNLKSVTVTLTGGSYYAWASKSIQATLTNYTPTGSNIRFDSVPSANRLATKTILNMTVTSGAKTSFSNKSVTFDVNLTAGTTYYIWFYINTTSGNYAYMTHGNAISASGQDAYAVSSLTANNGTLGSGMRIGITRADSSLRDTVTWQVGNFTGTLMTRGASTEINWTPPLTLAAENTTGTTLSCTFTLQTYSGYTLIGSTTSTVTLTIPNSCGAVISEVTLTPYNGTAATDAWLQGFSRADAVITAAGQYGASVTNYSMTIGTDSVSGGSTLRSGVILSGGTVTVAISVTDSRGIITTASRSISVLAYSPPSIVPATGYAAIICGRCTAGGQTSSSGSYLRILCKAQFAGLDGTNSATLSYRIGSGAWVTTDGDDIINAGFRIDTEYSVTLRVVDGMGGSYSIEYRIATDNVPLHLDAGGRKVGMGRYAGSRDNTLYLSFGIVLASEAYGSTYPATPEPGQVFLHLENGAYKIKIFNGSTWEG